MVKLHRSRKDRFFAGVIGGIVETYHLDIDVPLLRVLVFVSALFVPVLFPVYLIAGLVIPLADKQ